LTGAGFFILVFGMSSTAATRKHYLESKLSALCGIKIEITVRDLTEFTLSAEGNVLDQMEKARAFLSLTGQISRWEVSFDRDCDFTCAYFTVSK